MALQWRNALSVGNEMIDNDHKKLFALINEVEVALSGDNPVAEALVAIDGLATYTQEHFFREESIMINLRYIKFDHHKNAHRDLIAQLDAAAAPVRQLRAAQARGEATAVPPEARVALIALLRHWLLDHILKEDMHLKSLHLQEMKGPGSHDLCR